MDLPRNGDTERERLLDLRDPQLSVKFLVAHIPPVNDNEG